jgi:hypothetical protein
MGIYRQESAEDAISKQYAVTEGLYSSAASIRHPDFGQNPSQPAGIYPRHCQPGMALGAWRRSLPRVPAQVCDAGCPMCGS